MEIEINAMPQFDVQKSDKSHKDKQKIIWKGFIVPPVNGTVAVNHYPGDDGFVDEKRPSMINRAATQFIPVEMEMMTTQDFSHDPEYCEGCFVTITDANWHKDGKPYCSQCIKFRVYQECVRKFVLEYDNEDYG